MDYWSSTRDVADYDTTVTANIVSTANCWYDGTRSLGQWCCHQNVNQDWYSIFQKQEERSCLHPWGMVLGRQRPQYSSHVYRDEFVWQVTSNSSVNKETRAITKLVSAPACTFVGESNCSLLMSIACPRRLALMRYVKLLFRSRQFSNGNLDSLTSCLFRTLSGNQDRSPKGTWDLCK